MIFREARLSDIEQLQWVRNSVEENRLSDPSMVKNADYENYLTYQGKGWICETGNRIAGFAIVDLRRNNIWALFVHPDFSGKGIGKQLHQLMMDWYFGQTKETAWLSTAPGTKAEMFYLMQGWSVAGTYGKGEIKFEMSFEQWCSKTEHL